MGLAHAGEKPDRQSSCIGAGFIRVIRELLNGALQILLGVQVELFVIGAIMRYHLLNMLRLIKAAAAEGDGESLQAGMVGAGRVMQDGGRIDAATKPDSQGYV